jgi:hypothetical protein
MKKTTSILSALLMLLLPTIMLAQQPDLDFKHGLKLSNSITYQKETTYFLQPNGQELYSTGVQKIDLLNLIPAYMWQTKGGNFSELSIPMWRAQNSKTTVVDTLNSASFGRVSDLAIGVQYTYGFRFLKNKSTKLLPILGFGLMPYAQRTSYRPELSTYFPSRNFEAGLQGTLNPHVIWQTNSRLFLDLGVTLNIFKMSFNSELNNFPNVPIKEVSSFNWDMFAGAKGVQVGAGIKL